MMQYLKIEGKLILNHLSMLLVLLVFGPLMGFDAGVILFNIIATAFYFGLMYSTAWKTAKSDIDKFSTKKAYPAKGLVIGLVNLIVVLGVSFLMYLFRGNVAVRLIYGVWTMPVFIWYRYFDKAILPLLAMLLVLPVSTTVGYCFGMRKISFYNTFIYPLIYKTEKK